MNDDPSSRSQRPSYAQEAIWTIERTTPEASAYHIVRAYRLRGPVDESRLQEALRSVVRAHDALRSSLPAGPDGYPVLRVAPDGGPTLEVVPSTLSPTRDIGEDLRAELEQFAGIPFDLEAGPLCRARLYGAKDERILELVFHHTVIDGSSLATFLRQISTAYARPEEWSDLAREIPSYASYAAESRRRVDSGELEEDRAYWVDRLRGLPDLMQLQHDRPRPRMLSLRGATLTDSLPPELVHRVTETCSRYGVTPFVFTYALLQVLLHRYTGETDLLFGVPVRTVPEEGDWSEAVGIFLSTVVLRGDLSEDPPFADVLADSFVTTLEAMEHRELPFPKLVEALRREEAGGRAGQPFQVLLSFQHGGQEPFELPDVDAERIFVDRGGSQAELGFYFQWAGDGADIQVDYSTELFDRAHVRRLMEHFRTLLESVVADPERPISELEILTEGERASLAAWNDTTVAYAPPGTLHGLFEAQVRETPDGIAVASPEAGAAPELTYAELDDRASALAALLQERGVGRDVPVAVVMERSAELVVSLLAVLKAGGAYVPVDPGYPVERKRFMLEDSAAPVLLTQAHLVDDTPAVEGATVLVVDDLWPELTAGGTPAPEADPESLAYVIYTSGSTGKPKGAMIEHRSIVNRLLWMQEEYGLVPRDVVLQKTPYSFDVSVWEFFWPLSVGARLVMARPEGHMDPAYLVESVVEHGVTTMHFVPSMLEAFLEEPDVGRCGSVLRRVICSGEALTAALRDRFFERVEGPELHNLYGPTEAAVDVTYWSCEEDPDRTPVPIGRPVANTQTHVLDRHMKPVPVGMAGELHLGGVQVGRGYLNRPELTRERFVDGPEGMGRLYRTGDLVRWTRNGVLEFLGRLDHQVKVRGLRIELGEIEAVLGTHPDVRQAVAAVRSGADGDDRLVAYVVWEEGVQPLGSELRRFLRDTLPDYMVPGIVVDMDAIPLTPSGKADRKRLPNPLESVTSREYVEPRTELQRGVARVWRELLGRDEVGLHDNFFELGGHSLLAVRAVALMDERLGLRVDPRSMFFQTLEQVADEEAAVQRQA